MRTLIGLVEHGLIPDVLTRFGIRRLLRQRLQSESADSRETWSERQQKFLDELSSSPIAVNTEDANEQHYEVPASFFAAVLGPHLKYSSGWWPKGVKSLGDSEEAMLRVTGERAEIEDGMDVLDLGCGWGSLSLWIARNYPLSQVLAVSNSKPQADFIRNRCREFNVANLEVVTADMNTFEPGRRFDRVVSVEMFEHMRNWPKLLGRITSWLRPTGKMLMHVFCHREHVYPYISAGPNDWMAEHFFTGGIMPSDDLPFRFQDDLIVEKHWRINGTHYSRTLEAWLRQMDSHRDQVMQLLQSVYAGNARAWYQRWRVFFLACSELFAFRNGNEWWVSHYRLVPKSSSPGNCSTTPVPAPALVGD